MKSSLAVVIFRRNSELPFAIVHYWNAVSRKILKLHNSFFNKDSGRIIESDPKLGYSHIANSIRTHKTIDFQVTYTMGDDITFLIQNFQGYFRGKYYQ